MQKSLTLPHLVLDSPAYRGLSHTARSLLVDIARQMDGRNNGALVACPKYLVPLGWRSNDTVSRCLKELVAARLLLRTRQGSRPNRAAWYALTWQALGRSIQTSELDIDPSEYRTGGYKNASPTPSDGAESVR
jgi:hypothetical protein